jgi:hypothetical protein
MSVFQTAQQTYDHLSTVHGGIYEEAPAGVVVEDAWNQDFLAGQREALAKIERERVAREQVLRRPMAAAANPLVDQRQYADQLMAEQLRRARVRAAAEEQAKHARAREAFAEQQRCTRATRKACAHSGSAKARGRTWLVYLDVKSGGGQPSMLCFRPKRRVVQIIAEVCTDTILIVGA